MAAMPLTLSAAHPRPGVDQLRNDTDRYFFRGLGTYVNPYGVMNAAEVILGKSLVQQLIIDQALFSLAADHAYISGLRA